MTKQDILENPANMIYLGLGSNLGNKKKILKMQNLNLSKIKLEY